MTIEHYINPIAGRKRCVFVTQADKVLGEFPTKEAAKNFIRSTRDLAAGPYTLIDTEERFAAQYRARMETDV